MNNDKHHPQQKEQWAKEAEQLKKDLANRPKEIRRNPVNIKFGPQYKKQKANSPTQQKKTSTAKDDALFRQFLDL